MGEWLKVGVAVLLIVLNGFWVTVEFALVRVRIARLEVLRRKGSRRAAGALALVRNLGATLSTTQVGMTLASLGIGWLGEPAVAALLGPLFAPIVGERYVHPLSFLIGFLIVTLVTVVLGELVPKAIGIEKAEGVLLLAAVPVRLLRWTLYPIVALTNVCAKGALRALGIPPAFGEEAAHSEEELRAILVSSHARGDISRVGRDILERVLGFSRLTARQIMVPRPDVVWLSVTKSPQENREIARLAGYTRFPLCDGDLDRVLGVVHIKDVAGTGAGDDLTASMRPSLFVPETATADRLLRLFQKRRLHLAIVVDEYGGTSGVVTLEDVLEEIVGDVQDEFDQEVPDISPLGEGKFLISGTTRFEEVERMLGAGGESDGVEVDTIAGYVQERLGRIARAGDSVRLGSYRLRVEDVKKNRIVQLTAVREAEVAAPEEGADR